MGSPFDDRFTADEVMEANSLLLAAYGPDAVDDLKQYAYLFAKYALERLARDKWESGSFAVARDLLEKADYLWSLSRVPDAR